MRSPRPPAWAASFIGLPYRLDGRDRSGADCWGFVTIVLQEQFGFEVPTYDGKHWRAAKNSLRELRDFILSEAAAHWRPVERGQEQAGDVIVLRARNGVATHAGVVYAPGEMLHSEHEGTGGMAARYDGGFWADKIEGIWRWIGG